MGRFDEWLDDTRPVTVAPVTGIGDTIGMLMSHGNISPYIMAWLITVLIRLATGQGVVSAMADDQHDNQANHGVHQLQQTPGFQRILHRQVKVAFEQPE